MLYSCCALNFILERQTNLLDNRFGFPECLKPNLDVSVPNLAHGTGTQHRNLETFALLNDFLEFFNQFMGAFGFAVEPYRSDDSQAKYTDLRP